MAGYVASNIVDGEVNIVHYQEIDKIVEQGGLLVDVREPAEREIGFIPGSMNIPLGELRDRLEELPKDQIIYITCQAGLRGYLATRILAHNGYESSNLSGGYKTYQAGKRVWKESVIQS
ncbi:hypothetical protein LD39_12450 [Halobacillus sp. BBL2006]|nr:hypothetical protein LD39_12450 [Halobacillus sp. BBL2006]